jgi:hypothetical protein
LNCSPHLGPVLQTILERILLMSTAQWTTSSFQEKGWGCKHCLQVGAAARLCSTYRQSCHEQIRPTFCVGQRMPTTAWRVQTHLVGSRRLVVVSWKASLWTLSRITPGQAVEVIASYPCSCLLSGTWLSLTPDSLTDTIKKLLYLLSFCKHEFRDRKRWNWESQP